MKEAFDICYKIHAIATLLETDRIDGDENRIIEAWKTGNKLSNTISHTAGIIKNFNDRIFNILEEIETKLDATGGGV